jgi:hypothetical protein
MVRDGKEGTATPAQKKWIRILHIAKRECGLDDEAYRAVLAGAAGVGSARDIRTWEQYNDCLAAFHKLGFKIKSGMGGLKETDTETKRGMVLRIGGVSDIRFLGKQEARKVILALRDMAAKAGYDPDRPPDKGRGNAGIF